MNEQTAANYYIQKGQHPLTGQCVANFRWDLGVT